jgi:hypothetical protein
LGELPALAWSGWGAVAVLVVAWLTAAFVRGATARDRAAWLGATALYVALGSFFTHLFLNARADDSMPRMIAFGTLMTLFASGLVLSAVRLLRAFRTPTAAEDHATH